MAAGETPTTTVSLTTIDDGDVAAPAAPVAPATTIGRYRVLGELGAGGMGRVLAAHDADLDRKVAVKVLRGHAGDLIASNRLLREAQAMARLAHPNVVTVFEAGTDGDQVFIAMELVDGQTLAAWL